MRKLVIPTVSCVVLFCATLRADFSYQETTKMTGGALVSILRLGGPFTRKAREPIVSTVLIKGNRMATLGKDNSTIIDLDKETITEINLEEEELFGSYLRPDAAGHGRRHDQSASPAEEKATESRAPGQCRGEA